MEKYKLKIITSSSLIIDLYLRNVIFVDLQFQQYLVNIKIDKFVNDMYICDIGQSQAQLCTLRSIIPRDLHMFRYNTTLYRQIDRQSDIDRQMDGWIVSQAANSNFKWDKLKIGNEMKERRKVAMFYKGL